MYYITIHIKISQTLSSRLISAPADNNAQASRKIKIYLADKNSKHTSECGQDFPCPPPTSPAEGNPISIL